MPKLTPVFLVKISSPDEIIWEGEAKSLSSQNSAGAFDILPEHANFVTIINEGAPIKISRADGENRIFTFKTAVVSIVDGFVNIYVDI